MSISNNRLSFHLWWKENLVKHRKVSNYYETDYGINNLAHSDKEIATQKMSSTQRKAFFILTSKTIVYRNTWLGNTIIIFIIQEIWKNAHVNLTVHITVINDYKGEFKIRSNIWHGAFAAKSLLASEANSESCQTAKMKLFAKIVKN